MTRHNKRVIPAKAGIQPALEESLAGIMQENENTGKFCVLKQRR